MALNSSTTGNSESPTQEARRLLMRERTLTRLDLLLIAARASPFTTGKRITQPPEVQALQRRVRQVSERWSPRWTTKQAADTDGSVRVDCDHVVPVIVLVERMLLGGEIEPVLQQSVLCLLTHDEHRRGGLEVAFRKKQRDIYLQMLDCPLDELAELGWQRYRRVNIEWFPIEAEPSGA